MKKNHNIKFNYRGFTLIEIILVMTLIGILASIVLVSINPNRQLARARDTTRQANINEIQKAIDNYTIKNRVKYPSLITVGKYKPICGGVQISNCVSLSNLVPDYFSSIPVDPTGNNYLIGINPNNRIISLLASSAEQREVSINKFTESLPGDRDLSFDTGVPAGFNGGVSNIILQSNGKLLVGGDFSFYKETQVGGLARFNSDGTLDTSFNIGSGFNVVNGVAVSTFILQNDGKIIVGGNFTTYKGESANRIIRLNSDGSRDTSFNIGTGINNFLNYGVKSIILQSDGKILVGGDFSSYQGISTSGIIRLNSDGSRDTTLNTGTELLNITTVSLQSDGKILLGGWFTTYQGSASKYIIRLNSNGSRDTSFNVGSGFGNSPNIIITQSDGKILVGGYFTTYQGVEANYIIRLNSDGSRDTSFNMGTGFDNSPISMVLQSDGKILVGGYFTTYQGVTANYIIRLNSDGSKDNSFNIGTGFNSVVSSIIAQSDGKILVGGYFTTYQRYSANGIIRLNSEGSVDNSFMISIGTDFTLNGSVESIVTQSDGKILIGGGFTSYSSVSANYITRLNTDGSLDSTFNIGTGFSQYGQVYTIAVQSDGKILVGGIFTTYQGVSANRIVRLNSDGSRDNSFNMGTGLNGLPYRILLQSDGKILVGGSFTTYQGVSANRIVRLNSDGSRDNSFNMGTGFDGEVRTIALQGDGKILLGGVFTSYQGVSANKIIRLNNDGSRDNSFNIGTSFANNVSYYDYRWGMANITSHVQNIVIKSNGKILVGGLFADYQGVAGRHLIQLNSDGSRDTSFNTGTGFDGFIMGGAVWSMAVQGDGKIIVGGLFSSYQGLSANKIIRLNSDGTRDNGFNIGTGFGDVSIISNLSLQSDGNILVGGSIFMYKDKSANRLIRIWGY